MGTQEVYWLPKIELSEEREENIRDCFKSQAVDFDYPTNVEDFNDWLEMYWWKKADYIKNYLGENMILDRLIAMDDVSGLADKSEEFANFLTVSRKYGLACVYIFHTLYPTKHNYVSHRNLWNNQLYFEISNSRQKQCLTIDTCDVTDLGPAKFRTQADSGTETNLL